MDDILFLTLLFDFYGDLLTPKQYDVFYLYYQDNLSLSEIGDIYSISRQAVRDILLRTQKKLKSLECSLNLVQLFGTRKKFCAEVLHILDDMEANIDCSDFVLSGIDKIRCLVEKEEV